MTTSNTITRWLIENSATRVELFAKHSCSGCVPRNGASTDRIYEAIACARAFLFRTGSKTESVIYPGRGATLEIILLINIPRRAWRAARRRERIYAVEMRGESRVASAMPGSRTSTRSARPASFRIRGTRAFPIGACIKH